VRRNCTELDEGAGSSPSVNVRRNCTELDYEGDPSLSVNVRRNCTELDEGAGSSPSVNVSRDRRGLDYECDPSLSVTEGVLFDEQAVVDELLEKNFSALYLAIITDEVNNPWVLNAYKPKPASYYKSVQVPEPKRPKRVPPRIAFTNRYAGRKSVKSVSRKKQSKGNPKAGGQATYLDSAK
jgi:hypothetical protein